MSAATIRQREADLQLAQTNLDRSQNLFERQLIPKQTFDDTDARYQAAVAQLDLAKAQFAQAQARLDELKINLSNTIIASPVSGSSASASLDPGAWVTPNSPFISVVDIGVVRLVANIVEKDIRRITGCPPMSKSMPTPVRNSSATWRTSRRCSTRDAHGTRWRIKRCVCRYICSKILRIAAMKVWEFCRNSVRDGVFSISRVSRKRKHGVLT